MPINHKKYSCYSLKKIHRRNLIKKKNSCDSKIPHPPPTLIIFLMVYPSGRQSNPSSTEPIFFPLVCPRSYPWRELITCTSSSSFTTFFLTLLHTYFDHEVYHLFIPLHLHVWLTVDWLILLRWGSLELLQGTFVCVISGQGLVNNNIIDRKMGLMKIFTAMAGLGILLRNLWKWPLLGLDFSSERRVQFIFLITRKRKNTT